MVNSFIIEEGPTTDDGIAEDDVAAIRFNFTLREYCFDGFSYILNGNNDKYNFWVSYLLLMGATMDDDIINIYYSHIMFIMFYIYR